MYWSILSEICSISTLSGSSCARRAKIAFEASSWGRKAWTRERTYEKWTKVKWYDLAGKKPYALSEVSQQKLICRQNQTFGEQVEKQNRRCVRMNSVFPSKILFVAKANRLALLLFFGRMFWNISIRILWCLLSSSSTSSFSTTLRSPSLPLSIVPRVWKWKDNK